MVSFPGGPYGRYGMMTISVRSLWNAERTGQVIRARCEAAAEQLGNQVLVSSGRYVPYDTGRLAGSGQVNSSGGSRRRVIWQTPYAKAVYYGDQRGIMLKKERNPRASFAWFEAAKGADLALWTSDAAKVIGGEAR